MAEYTGRGPTRARTTISNRWVFVTLEETLTKGERQLVANGHAEQVLATRKSYQHIMRRSSKPRWLDTWAVRSSRS
jgi:uncharacterized protein YbcI